MLGQVAKMIAIKVSSLARDTNAVLSDAFVEIGNTSAQVSNGNVEASADGGQAQEKETRTGPK